MTSKTCRYPLLRFLAGPAALLGVAAMVPADACAAAPVANGVWGARDAILTIEPQQSRIEWGTGNAVIDGPVKADASGRFKATGRYHAYAPGPARIGMVPLSRDMRIEGRIAGDTVQMMMQIAGEPDARHYLFKKGQRTKLHRMY